MTINHERHAAHGAEALPRAAGGRPAGDGGAAGRALPGRHLRADHAADHPGQGTNNNCLSTLREIRLSPWYQCVVSLIFLANATINLMF